MITFEKINALKIAYKDAYRSFYSQIIDNPYEKDYQTAIYEINYVGEFENEFNTAVFNSLSDRPSLKAYIEKVYYEDIVFLFITFSNLCEHYREKSQYNIIQLAAGKDDDLFNRIASYASGLRLAADKIYSEAKKQRFILKHYSQITLTKTDVDEGYNLLGQYIPLFKSPVSNDIDTTVNIHNAEESVSNVASNTIVNHKSGKTNKPFLISYQWLGQIEEIESLYEKMKGTLIINDISLDNFRNIFSEKDISEIIPVKWHDNNASELLYFISVLREKGLIEMTKQISYKRLKGCFVKSDGSLFTEQFRALKQGLDLKLSSEKKDKIDKIIYQFL